MSQHGCPERLSNRSKGFQEDGPSQPTMEVLVETLTGTAFEMTVSPSDTIFAIKSKIYRVEGIPVSQQHLVYNLRELEDGLSLRAHGVPAGARLRLVLGMRGGPVATRRLPPPEPWRDVERLLDNREDSEWCSSGSFRVTVLVFRDGERVNMLRVRQNRDGSYSPLDHTKYPSSLSQLSEQECPEALGSLQQNAVTMGKMQELRARMETLSLRRHHTPQPRRNRNGEKAEIQKTRSEETLSVPSLLDDATDFTRTYTPYSEAEDTFAPLYDGNYTRYDYGCSFTDRYTLLPPIGSRTDSEHSVDTEERLKLSDALSGSILVKGRQRDDEAAILEECLDGEECHMRQDSQQLAAKNLAPIPTAEYGPLVGGEGGWVARGFGAALSHAHPHAHPHAHAHGHSHSASSLHLRPPVPLLPPPRLASSLFSSSTSDLEQLRRNRLLPALSRHRNNEHLHLSDDRLDRKPANNQVSEDRHIAPPVAPRPSRLPPGETPPAPRGHGDRGAGEDCPPKAKDEDKEAREEKDNKEVKEKKARVRCGLCRRRLSIATVHRCRCDGCFCAPHRYAEVHGCAFDYKAHGTQHLRTANPQVTAPKLPKI